MIPVILTLQEDTSFRRTFQSRDRICGPRLPFNRFTRYLSSLLASLAARKILYFRSRLASHFDPLAVITFLTLTATTFCVHVKETNELS